MNSGQILVVSDSDRSTDDAAEFRSGDVVSLEANMGTHTLFVFVNDRQLPLHVHPLPENLDFTVLLPPPIPVSLRFSFFFFIGYILSISMLV
jgi:hypothetical protein